MMSNQRHTFLSRLVSDVEKEKYLKSKAALPHFVTAPPEPRRPRSFYAEIPKEEASFMYYVPNRDPPPPREASRVVPQMQGSNRPSPTNERSMLEQAWHTVMTYDPLIDSDEESQDEHVQLEYTRRLGVISRLRGRPPTPEPDEENIPLGRFQQVQSWD